MLEIASANKGQADTEVSQPGLEEFEEAA